MAEYLYSHDCHLRSCTRVWWHARSQWSLSLLKQSKRTYPVASVVAFILFKWKFFGWRRRSDAPFSCLLLFLFMVIDTAECSWAAFFLKGQRAAYTYFLNELGWKENFYFDSRQVPKAPNWYHPAFFAFYQLLFLSNLLVIYFLLSFSRMKMDWRLTRTVSWCELVSIRLLLYVCVRVCVCNVCSTSPSLSNNSKKNNNSKRRKKSLIPQRRRKTHRGECQIVGPCVDTGDPPLRSADSDVINPTTTNTSSCCSSWPF